MDSPAINQSFQELAIVARRIDPWGWCGVSATEVGIVGASLAHNSEPACLDALRAASTGARHRSRGAQRLRGHRVSSTSVVAAGRSAYHIAGNGIEQLWEYFMTGRQRLDAPLDTRAGTDFQCATWDVLRDIAFGETRSYGWVANAIQNPEATQAIGTATGSNQLLIFIPCHRIVGARGIGGYSRGAEIKRRLLDHERSWPRMHPLFRD